MPSRAKRERGLERRRRERNRVAGRWGQLVADLSEPGGAVDGPGGVDRLRGMGAPGGEVGAGDLSAGSAVAGDLVRWRRRAERAEAELAGLRRSAARRLLELGREAVYWRLRAEGRGHGEASRRAAGWWPDSVEGGGR